MIHSLLRTASRALIAGAATLALVAIASPAAAQEKVNWDSYQKQAREVPKDTIPQDAYSGWKQYELNCSRCHGEFGVGTTFAPALIASLKDGGTIPDQGAFISVVCQGRKEKGMPSWCEAGLEPDKMLNMYAYLKLRADGKVGGGRPAVKPEGR